jgi:pyruvate dehydrogenase E2 component (dihydrolipoamide acetyltransferase)
VIADCGLIADGGVTRGFLNPESAIPQSAIRNSRDRKTMATDVVMPQMGESIAEGTIVRWIKKVGDTVDRDEPLFEISTDKVDAEIPSPVAGVISEIRVKEGETVPVNSVVAVIGGAAAAGAPPAAATDQDEAARTTPAPDATAPETPKPSPQADGSPTAAAAPNEQAPAGGHYHDRDEPAREEPPALQRQDVGPARPEPTEARASSVEETVRERSSPLVRKIAKEHNVDISQIHGTGIAGRVTKDDILGYIEKGQVGQGSPAGQARQVGRAGPVGQVGQAEKSGPAPAAPQVRPAASDRVEKMSVMRKRIAEHMVLSRKTSAHVHSVFEVNFSQIAKIREAKKAEFERAAVKLTYMSFIIKAAVDALREVPIVNASVDGDTVIYHKDVNVGIAVALDWGLIVPVIKHADELNLLGLSRAVVDLATRARNKQLKPDEVSGGTFTITNPGVFGALFGMPIINQPQVAILGVGNVEKRPVVVDDAIAIRPMAYLTLGYDHRVIDGAVADQFMSGLKKSLENWDPSAT